MIIDDTVFMTCGMIYMSFIKILPPFLPPAMKRIIFPFRNLEKASQNFLVYTEYRIPLGFFCLILLPTSSNIWKWILSFMFPFFILLSTSTKFSAVFSISNSWMISGISFFVSSRFSYWYWLSLILGRVFLFYFSGCAGLDV